VAGIALSARKRLVLPRTDHMSDCGSVWIMTFGATSFGEWLAAVRLLQFCVRGVVASGT
jgi:hypothetical protein